MEFLIVTGMSGAGKGQVLKYLEDMGYYCVDNMPPVLLDKFATLCAEGGFVEKPAFVIDVRGGKFLEAFMPSLNSLKETGNTYKVLFMEASDETIVRRYKENRRVHPLLENGGYVLDAIDEERQTLQPLKEVADFVIDTSTTTLQELRKKVQDICDASRNVEDIQVNVVSFGFKYGTPIDCDLVFDVRFIPNPFYIEELKYLAGTDKPVSDYVLSSSETVEFIAKLSDMLDFLLPNYVKEGKSTLSIGIGCTGGRHRSVAIAEEVYRLLQEKNFKTSIKHRDIGKDARGVVRCES